jgi:hypothetical protein
VPDKMSIAELSAAIKRREPRLASVPDAELVRKVLERRPELMSMINTSEPRRPLDLYGKIGSRLKGNLDLPSQAQGAADAIHEGLKNIREHGPSKMPEFLAALKQYGKPENAIGDVLTALILGQGGEAKSSSPKPAGVPEARPPMDRLTALREGGEATRRSSDQFIQDVIRRKGLPTDPALADIEAAIKARFGEIRAKYGPPGKFESLKDPLQSGSKTPPPPSTTKPVPYYERYGKIANQPAAFTEAATDWHNSALAQAKAQLGPDADLGAVLQLAAKIQKAGRP